jgi:hypothetical protein
LASVTPRELRLPAARPRISKLYDRRRPLDQDLPDVLNHAHASCTSSQSYRLDELSIERPCTSVSCISPLQALAKRTRVFCTVTSMQ